jgi:hypothetical protein
MSTNGDFKFSLAFFLQPLLWSVVKDENIIRTNEDF